MSYKLIRRDLVRQALGDLGERVRTKEVSKHPAMIAGHPELVSQRNYHQWVGKCLSQECSEYVRRVDVPDTDGGALWSNLLFGSGIPSTPEESPRVAAQADLDGGNELGPQSASDKPFTARMRLHQSWYRAHVLHVPCGTGPEQTSTQPYGNMLRSHDAERGLNFITPEIFQAARKRIAQRTGVVDEFRLLHNMLSSQPLCFNLFAPLAADLQLATRLVCAIPGLSARRVLRVELEYTPGDRTAYLNDGTAFDAYIEYEQIDGRPAFIGIEVKLTEPFSQKVYDSPSYRRWMTGARSPWRPEAAQQAAALQHNQLWRDHLLAVAHRDQQGSTFAHGRLMLVRHPEDRSCEQVVNAYSQLLCDGDDSLIDMTLDRLITIWNEAVTTEAEHSWLAEVKDRYLDLEKSAQLWTARGARR